MSNIEKLKLRKNIGIRIISMVFVVLLVSTLFVPVVAAQSTEQSLAIGPIELLSSSETTREYIVYSDDAKSTAEYFVHQERITVDQNQVWTSEVHQVMSDGTVSSDVVFGKDSYWWFDANGGFHVHLGPIDVSYLMSAGPLATTVLGSYIGGGVGTAVGLALGIALIAVLYLYTNPDNSFDFYADQLTLTLIPIYMGMPANPPVIVQLGTHDVPLMF